MRRDWELVRQILVKLEATEGGRLSPGDVGGYDEDIVSYHLRLLDEAGLIKAKCVSGGARPHCVGLSLTWDGHEFLDQVRSATAWNQIKGILREKSIDMTIEAIRLAAKSVIENVFGG